MKQIRTLLLVFLTILISVGFSQTKIDEIVMNPGRYAQESVTVTGTVTQYVAATTITTSYYILKSDFGAVIRVNTSSSRPDVNYKYSVEGTVVMETSGPVIIEVSRVCLNCPTIVSPQISFWKKYWYILVIIGVLLIAAIVLILIFAFGNKRKNREEFIAPPIPEPYQPRVESPEPPEIPRDKTLVSVVAPDATYTTGTLKFTPMGKLEIQSGPDAGKNITLSGFQTGEGIVMSIGRDVPDWKEYLISSKNFSNNRLLSHILIKDPTNTLSRLHAELIYKNDHLYLRHTGGNATILDGDAMSPGETRKLNVGSIIQAGAMEFKYLA